MITLYEFALSGNCHKIRLLLSLIGLRYQSIAVNGSEQQNNWGQSKNNWGQSKIKSS